MFSWKWEGKLYLCHFSKKTREVKRHSRNLQKNVLQSRLWKQDSDKVQDVSGRDRTKLDRQVHAISGRAVLPHKGDLTLSCKQNENVKGF